MEQETSSPCKALRFLKTLTDLSRKSMDLRPDRRNRDARFTRRDLCDIGLRSFFQQSAEILFLVDGPEPIQLAERLIGLALSQESDGLAILGILLATNLRQAGHGHLGELLQCAERIPGLDRGVLFDVTHQENSAALLLSENA